MLRASRKEPQSASPPQTGGALPKNPKGSNPATSGAVQAPGEPLKPAGTRKRTPESETRPVLPGKSSRSPVSMETPETTPPLNSAMTTTRGTILRQRVWLIPLPVPVPIGRRLPSLSPTVEGDSGEADPKVPPKREGWQVPRLTQRLVQTRRKRTWSQEVLQSPARKTSMAPKSFPPLTGQYGTAQLQDPTLTNALKNVQVIEGVVLGDRTSPTYPHFAVNRGPRGLLDIAKEAWEEQPCRQRTLIEHVGAMRENEGCLSHDREQMETAQRQQQASYNRSAQPREFKPGDRVLVLVPTVECKFLATWQGPYEVIERVGEVNYKVRQLDKRKPEQIYHVNLLKKWHAREALFSCLPPTETKEPGREEVQVGPSLSPHQRQMALELVDRNRDVFSSLPGHTEVVQHEIRTMPGKTVNQLYRVRRLVKW
ncbi:hypothetical protein AALO_G00300500 [Alosa alosa]|uniref:Integrase p58-like C-terminal domain-containing protein n=1 Tax=Alosa alosa TaxID=278164 RepID=A0AAV6FHM5_9TELE|nr:hypothetical protein AALO_G00300500 [Alosa alosa]